MATVVEDAQNDGHCRLRRTRRAIHINRYRGTSEFASDMTVIPNSVVTKRSTTNMTFCSLFEFFRVFLCNYLFFRVSEKSVVNYFNLFF